MSTLATTKPAPWRPAPRRLLWVIAGLAVLGGTVWGWSWLSAVGVGSLLLSVLPCAAMCALGLCMGRRGAGSCKSGQPGQQQGEEQASQPAAAPVQVH